MPMLLFRQIALDANGLPLRHSDGLQAAARELIDFVNELPQSFYHLGESDADLATERMVSAYLHAQWTEPRRARREALQAVHLPDSKRQLRGSADAERGRDPAGRVPEDAP